MKNTLYLPFPPASVLLAALRNQTVDKATRRGLLAELKFGYPMMYRVFNQ